MEAGSHRINMARLQRLLRSVEELTLVYSLVYVNVATFEVSHKVTALTTGDLILIMTDNHTTLHVYDKHVGWQLKLQNLHRSSRSTWKEVLVTWLWGYEALLTVRSRKKIKQPCTQYHVPST